VASTKIRNIAVKTGSYQDPQTGETKGRYQNVGALMKGEDGNEFIMLAKWFNPAGIASDREAIILSCFKLQDQQSAGEQSGGQRQGNSNRQTQQRQQPPADDPDIPF